MRGSLHQPSRGMDPPALWDRMQLDAPTMEQLSKAMKIPLLERLEASDVHKPLLLQRLDMNDALDTSHQGTFPLDLRMKIPIKTTWMGMNNVTQKTNVLNTWTTSLKTSGKGKVRNSKHSPISFQSSTSTHQEPRKPRTLLLNITQEH